MPLLPPDVSLEVGNAASRLLREALRGSIWNGEAPVPVELITESLRGLTIEWTPLVRGEAALTLLGALDREARVLYLNENERLLFQRTIGLERFTIGHELGHFELHATPGRADGGSSCGVGDVARREVEAETFSAYLLMPAKLVRHHAQGTNTALWPRIYSLREIFGVSATAMVYRLHDLGYKTPERSRQDAS